MTPMKKWEAKTDCEDLARELRQENTAGRPFPAPHDFTAWAKRELRDPEAGVDPWGSRYYLKPARTPDAGRLARPGPEEGNRQTTSP